MCTTDKRLQCMALYKHTECCPIIFYCSPLFQTKKRASLPGICQENILGIHRLNGALSIRLVYAPEAFLAHKPNVGHKTECEHCIALLRQHIEINVYRGEYLYNTTCNGADHIIFFNRLLKERIRVTV